MTGSEAGPICCPARRRQGSRRRSTRVVVPAAVALMLLVGWWAPGVAVAASGMGAVSGRLEVFSVATAVQFINNADDEVRGAGNNPFGAATAKLQPRLSLKGNGPFAGDVTVYSFDLYGDAALHGKTGSASLTCYYNYRAHALCMAYYELSGGTIVASGPVDFTGTGFTLVVTGVRTGTWAPRVSWTRQRRGGVRSGCGSGWRRRCRRAEAGCRCWRCRCRRSS
jgi:hypothetical protein